MVTEIRDSHAGPKQSGVPGSLAITVGGRTLMSDGSKVAAMWRGEDLQISVRVQPRASRNAIDCDAGGRLRVRTMAPPVGGKANQAAARLLAEYFAVPASRIELLRGRSASDKQFLVKRPARVPAILRSGAPARTETGRSAPRSPRCR